MCVWGVRIQREREKLTLQLNNEKEAKETEVETLKEKINSLEKAGQNTKHMNEMKESYNEKILSTVSHDFINFNYFNSILIFQSI